MSTKESDIDFNQLKKNHLSSLRDFMNQHTDQKKNILKDYYSSLYNTLDYNEACRTEQLKFNKLKTSEKQNEHVNKVIRTNYNLEYCEYCRISYWPSNCCVYMMAKTRMTHKNSQVFRRYKLFDYKPKYKSFKDRLLSKILNRGSTLIYECKRCKSKNVIYKEFKRQTQFKVSNKVRSKQLMKHKDLLKVTFNKFSNEPVTTAIASCNNKVCNNNNNNNNNNKFSGRKRFASLQARLKQDEMQQEKMNQERNKSVASIFDFLNKLN